MSLFVRQARQRRILFLWLFFLSVLTVSGSSAAEKTTEELCEAIGWDYVEGDWGCIFDGVSAGTEQKCDAFFEGITTGTWLTGYLAGDPDNTTGAGFCRLMFNGVFKEPCRKAGFAWVGTPSSCYDSAEDVPKEMCLNKDGAYWGKSTKKCYPSPRARDEAERKK
jgi:hypothetical protein